MGNTTSARINNAASNQLSQTHGEGEFGGDREIGRTVRLAITMSSSYATGGDTLDLSQFFKYQVNFVGIFPNGSKFIPVYVGATATAPNTTPATGTVKIIDSTTGNEVANTTNLSAQTFNLIATGT